MVTDSAANVPPDLAEDLGIRIVPLQVRLGDRSFRDGVDLVGGDFYERLLAEPGVASTSSPSPGDFLEAYRAVGGEDIVCVTLASLLSGTYQEARLAADELGGSVDVVDSGSATMGEGFVAIEAAREARRGATREQVAQRARLVAGGVGVVGAIETFEFLRRSGRVSKMQAYAATKLDIKPVFRLEDGVITPLARPRTRTRALSRVLDETLEAARGRPLHVAAFHARAEAEARDLIERVTGQAKVVESFVVDSTPAIGAHTGPGLVGLAFFCD